MNGKIFGTSATAIFAALILFGQHGAAIFGALGALPALIKAFASGLPGGFYSFLLSAAVSGLAFSFVRRWSECPNPARKEFLCHLFGLLVGVGVTFAQATATDRTAIPDLLQALWIGLLAGGLSPKVVLGLASFTKADGKAPAAGHEP